MFEAFHQRAKLYMTKIRKANKQKISNRGKKISIHGKIFNPQVIYKMLVKTVMNHHFITSKSEVIKLTPSAD